MALVKKMLQRKLKTKEGGGREDVRRESIGEQERDSPVEHNGYAVHQEKQEEDDGAGMAQNVAKLSHKERSTPNTNTHTHVHDQESS